MWTQLQEWNFEFTAVDGVYESTIYITNGTNVTFGGSGTSLDIITTVFRFTDLEPLIGLWGYESSIDIQQIGVLVYNQTLCESEVEYGLQDWAKWVIAISVSWTGLMINLTVLCLCVSCVCVLCCCCCGGGGGTAGYYKRDEIKRQATKVRESLAKPKVQDSKSALNASHSRTETGVPL